MTPSIADPGDPGDPNITDPRHFLKGYDHPPKMEDLYGSSLPRAQKGVPPVIIHFNQMFQYKLSSYWGTPVPPFEETSTLDQPGRPERSQGPRLWMWRSPGVNSMVVVDVHPPKDVVYYELL